MSYVSEANWDRIVRILLGIALLYLGWAGVVTGGLGLFLNVIGFVPLITGLAGCCPLYAVLKFRASRA